MIHAYNNGLLYFVIFYLPAGRQVCEKHYLYIVISW